MISHIIGTHSVTVFVDANSHTISKTAKTYPLVMQAIKDNDINALRAAVNIRENVYNRLKKYSDNISISENQIFYKDREVTGLISSRIFEMLQAELDIKPMVLFLDKLMSNPSKRAVDELFGFLDACNLPITPDGNFLAYKRVRDDYKDVHSGTMDNSVGKVLEMPRNMVDEDKNNTCSYGLHFCSYDYLKHFGGSRIMVLEINPADVVAIPADYNNSKGRTCRYKVVDEIEVNEYNMPSKQITEGYTDEYSEEDTEDSEQVQDSVKPNPSAKLTERDVKRIREIWETYTDKSLVVHHLMLTHGISRRQLMRIINRESWKNVH